MPWWIGVLIIAAFLAPWTMVAAGALRAKRQDELDILKNGRSATGTVVEIRNDLNRGGQIWAATVEFPVPDRPEPVRFEVRMRGSLGLTPKPFRDLREGQSLTVHYREKWPSLAVVDDWVS